MSTPVTKVARQALMTRWLANGAVRSQAAFVDLLAVEGLNVTQATVSRDLDELGAVRLRGDRGHLVYTLPDESTSSREPTITRLSRLLEELMVGVDASANLVVVHTPPGAAQFLASAMDHGTIGGVIGTVAGDDTVLVVTADPMGGATVAQRLLDLANGHSAS